MINKADLKQWLHHWDRTQAVLVEVKKRELSQFSYQDNYTMIDDMLNYACSHIILRETSGLVEQQRLFHLGTVTK